MSTYEFTLVVEGLSVDDPMHDERLRDADAGDAMLFERDGTTYASFYRDAPSALEAVLQAVTSIRVAYPLSRVVYLDPDLVSTSDVADRVGLTRQAVGLYVVGKRGPGGFPRPEAVVGSGQRVWRWAAVHAWLVSSDVGVEFEDDAAPVPVDDVVQVQEWLRRRRVVGSGARMMARSMAMGPDNEAVSRVRVATRGYSYAPRLSPAHWADTPAAKQSGSYTVGREVRTRRPAAV